MGLQLHASKSQLSDLKRIVDAGADSLGKVLAVLSKQATPALDPEALIGLSEQCLQKETAQSLIRQLLSFHGVKRQTGLGIDDVFESLREVITQQGRETGISLEVWRDVEPVLRELAETTSTRVVTKAIELAYDYTNLLRRTKIITDIRPLYDDSGSDIEACIVSYTLRLRFDSADGEHELSIALDNKDLLQLVDQCDRAIVKAATAKAFMANSRDVPCRIAGESDE